MMQKSLSGRKKEGAVAGIAGIEPRMEHGWNTEAVTAPPKTFGATGRAPVLRSSPATPVLRSSAEGGEGGKRLLSPISAPPFPFRVPSVFHPWPQILRELLMGFSMSPSKDRHSSRQMAR